MAIVSKAVPVPELVPVKRALLSVFDKTGLVDFAKALSERGVFPSVALKMVEVGESTGALQEMLTSVADFFDEEIDTQLGRFITIIEPALLVIMGIVIAALLLALYMPLLQLGSVLA